MWNVYSKNVKIGNLSLSLIYNEILIIYRGTGEVYVKKISLKHLEWLKKPMMALAILLLGISIYSLLKPASAPIQTTKLDEDSLKNTILKSSDTDFTEPEKHKSLVIRMHKVKKGESLGKIAKDYGVSLDTIVGNNKLNSYSVVSEGTILKIPSRDGILYQMKKGQDLVSLAKKYRASVDKIVAENNIKNPDFISSNLLLFIPDAKPINIIQGFIWPAQQKKVTSSYGWRNHPIFNYRHFHQGIDIISKYQPVKATRYGKVTFAGWMGGYGRAVVIAHPGGWKSLYGHLSRIYVKNGQYVKQGQYIAKSGNTGNSTGPHLHFELIKNGDHINPYKYFRKKKK